MFPASAVIDGISVGPMTLGHAAMLDYLGVDLADRIDANSILIAAWVLSLTGDDLRRAMAERSGILAAFEKWCKGRRKSAARIAKAIISIVEEAYSTFVPPKREGDVSRSLPSGYGYPLEVCELLCAEYGMPFSEAMDVPMARVYAMLACARARHGGEAGGPDYYERRMLRDIKSLQRGCSETDESRG